MMSYTEPNKSPNARAFNLLLDSFKNDFERANLNPFNNRWDFPTVIEEKEIRLAPYELIDRGDKFELSLEMPGIDKKNIDIKATKSFIEVSATLTEKKRKRPKIIYITKDRGKPYIEIFPYQKK